LKLKISTYKELIYLSNWEYYLLNNLDMAMIFATLRK
jgi:hypothetical protein